MRKGTLVIVRHGESESNKQKTFSGWFDTDLTTQGIVDAEDCGKLLKRHNFVFDSCFSSYLKRSIRTLWTIMDVLDQMWVPMYSSWRLNELHYGEFTLMKYADVREKYPDIHEKYRTLYDIVPPQVSEDDPRAPHNMPRYAQFDRSEMPLGESLEMGWKRLEPYWKSEILSRVANGENVLVVAHGNIIRAMNMHVKGLTKDEVAKDEVVANGCAQVYEFEDGVLVNSKVLGKEE